MAVPARDRTDEPDNLWRSRAALSEPAFFTQALDLPLDSAVVIDNTFYGAPLRPRIDFAPTIREHEYSGLHPAVIHPDNGTIDSHHLAFADHGISTVLDERLREKHSFSLEPGTIRDGSPGAMEGG